MGSDENEMDRVLEKPFQPEEQPGMKYWAFISYSHQDEVWARWLHTALETYRVPRSLVGREVFDAKVPRRVFPVFRDRDELPGAAELNVQIESALRQSRNVIAICSPRSAVSKWVNEEIKTFKSMGRENRVFCLIVDGEPNASDKPDQGLLECFPPAVRFRVTREAELTSTRTEPIAADAREGKDGKANARLKLIAGILGVGYDDLKQRERRRQRWKMVRLAITLLIVLTLLALVYVAVADRGLDIWRGDAVRNFLDAHQWSQFRRVHRMADIVRTASVQRLRLYNKLQTVQRPDGWLMDNYHPGFHPDEEELWSHAQNLTGLLDIPVKTAELRRFIPCLATPFTEPTRQREIRIEGDDGALYGWVAKPYWCYPMGGPAYWIAASLAAALGRKGLLTPNERQSCLRNFAYTQEVLKNYRPPDDAFNGGWGMFLQPLDKRSHYVDAYATVIALIALLETRRAHLSWEGSEARRDELIARTANWLVNHFQSTFTTTVGATGWRAGWNSTGDIHARTFDGLTLQIYAVLLQTSEETGYQIPDDILREIPRHLADCATRNFDYSNDGAEFSSPMFEVHTHHDKHRVVGWEQVTFLWYPWAIDCAARWLRHPNLYTRSPEDLTVVQRALGHLVIDLGKSAVPRDISAEWTYLTTEHLFGLSAVK